MKLTDSLNEVVEIDNKEYKVDMAYDNILRFYELYEDAEIDDYKKLDYMFEMLICDSEELTLSQDLKKEVIEQVMKNYVVQEEEKEEDPEDESGDDLEGQDEEIKVKEYDITIDASLIYASFVYDYKIDLFEEQGKLHWKKFIALLNGLSEESPFMKVINIRTCEVPKPNKHNGKEIAQMRKLKRRYSLGKQSEQNMQSGLSKAATFLRSKAKTKVGDKK